jgi:uncharacterized protein (DUF885 family)
MKGLFKWLGLAAGAALLLLALAAINVIWFKPFSIRVFYETAFMKFMIHDPESLSYMRLLEPLGITFHNDDLTDVSPAMTEYNNRLVEENHAMLKRYDRSRLTGQDALSYDILAWFLENQVQGIPYTWHGYPVNQMFGVQNALPRFMASIHHIGSAADARDYIARLSKFPRKFDQLLEDLALREGRKIVPPRFTVDRVLDEMRGFRGTPAKENVLYTSFLERLDKVGGLDAAVRERLATDALAEIESSVYPAYDRLIGYFEHLQQVVTTDHGVWALPDGDAYYDYMLRQNTTTDLTADQIHAIGLAEVARIQGEMDAILREQGYTEGTVAERMTALNAEERFLYPDTDTGRAQILADYAAIIDGISAGMGRYFGRMPRSPVKVERVPVFSEKGSSGAYYQAPARDGSRPGIFYVNLRSVNEHPKWDMRTLAYHEGVPGHHFQSALQVEMEGVPSFRNFLGFTAYAEGWGLYAERLAWEAGYLTDPFSNLGRLRAELFRAVRLVVDTGIHRKRWSREQAIAYMLANTGNQESDVTAEIERYFVMPGQATAYKIGMMKILELRTRAQDALGNRFDIRAFHDVVIGDGDMPLEILERRVDEWIGKSATSDKP